VPRNALVTSPARRACCSPTSVSGTSVDAGVLTGEGPFGLTVPQEVHLRVCFDCHLAIVGSPTPADRSLHL